MGRNGLKWQGRRIWIGFKIINNCLKRIVEKNGIQAVLT